MAKKRTKKQKQSAKHQFVYHWGNDAPGTDVKGQKKSSGTAKKNSQPKAKNTQNKAKDPNIDFHAQEIKRSILLASLILGTELVIYLIYVN